MKKYGLLIILFVLDINIMSDSYAQKVDTDSILNAYVAPPSEVAKAQFDENREIQYMIDNYSVEEMAQLAIQLNQALRREAISAGETPPAKLSAEVLQNKEKLGEYLRSQYKFSY